VVHVPCLHGRAAFPKLLCTFPSLGLLLTLLTLCFCQTHSVVLVAGHPHPSQQPMLILCLTQAACAGGAL
jgi:hypothetical protein